MFSYLSAGEGSVQLEFHLLAGQGTFIITNLPLTRVNRADTCSWKWKTNKRHCHTFEQK